MSHFSRLEKARVTSLEAFLAAMAELGMTQVSHNVEIRAWDTNDAPVRVDVFAQIPGCKYGVGLIREDSGFYSMISDWSLTGASLPKAVKAKLPPGFPGTDGEGNPGFKACEALRGLALQTTTKHAIIAKYRRMGFRATVSEDAERNLNISLERF